MSEIFLPAGRTLVELAGGGSYGLPEEVDLFRNSGFGVVQDVAEGQIAWAQLTQRTALAATLHGDVDTEIRGGFFASTGLVWIVRDPNNFDDAVAFWNRRAVRPRYRWPAPVSVITTAEVARSREFRDDLASALRESSTSEPAFLVAGFDMSDAELEDIAAQLPASKHTDTRWTEGRMRSARAKDEEPLSFVSHHDPLADWIAVRKAGRPAIVSAQLERPDFEVKVPSPQFWAPEYLMTGKVSYTISSPAIAGPTLPQVARLYHREAFWVGDSIGLLTNNASEYAFRLLLPTPDQILRAAVSAKDYQFTRSDKGQQIAGVVAQGAALSFYRQRDTIRVIQLLTGKPGRDLVRELRRLRESGLASPADVSDLQARSVLGRRPTKTIAEIRSGFPKGDDHVPSIVGELVERGLAEMGMTVECALCALIDFQLLRTVERGAECRGCGSKARFQTDQSGAPHILYRLGTLMHTLSLNGGLAPLAAYALLAAENAYVEPGVNLAQQGSPAGEVDILGWVNDKLFAGEAKMSADGFAVANVQKDLAKASAMGADTFVAICLDALPQSFHERLTSGAAEVGLELRVLDGTALIAE